MPVFPQLPGGQQKLVPVSVALLVILSGCSRSEPEPEPAGPPTFHEQVAPILNAQCVSCHREGGIGPFRLDRYEDAQRHAGAIAVSTRMRLMPPWGVENDGTCQTFHEARWLSDTEIDTLSRWAQAGALEGDPAKAPPPPQAPATLGADALTLAMAAPYKPMASEKYALDDYRCFRLDPNLSEDRFVTGFEVLPGNTSLVHHVLVYSVDPQQQVGTRNDGTPITNAQVMANLEQAAGERGGWSCFGAAGEGIAINGLPVTWAPGTGVTRYPAGTGVALRKGHQLVMQVHYHLHGEQGGHGKAGMHNAGGGVDQTRLKLAVAKQVERPALMELPDGFLDTTLTNPPAELPPGRESVSFTWTMDGDLLAQYFQSQLGTPTSRFELLGVFPHMHGAGRKLSASLVGGGTEVCAAQVSRWDFDWQQIYFYETPVSWASTQDLQVTCTYDTRGRTGPTRPGFGTEDEMCLFGVFVVPAR
jgi:hypothetical protein